MAHAVQTFDPELLVDMATLTGAQMVSSPACYSQMTLRACQVTTGRKHAGVVSDSERLEQAAVAAGKASGDLVFPMLYCPEMLPSCLRALQLT